MRFTADERRRMYERQRDVQLRQMRTQTSAHPAAGARRIPTRAVVAVTVAGLVAIAVTAATSLSLSLPGSLLDAFMPALW
ncbi:MAG: hypothetical protein HY216_16805 [Candidatus Rokubacteria bacterium]|nr:hypothetical protein [Candidatus Rokubacteria bacterium]